MSGHALKYEGAPHDEAGQRIVPGNWWAGVGGEGRAKCACGEMSEVLPSAYKRKQWYREHRDKVTEAERG